VAILWKIAPGSIDCFISIGFPSAEKVSEKSVLNDSHNGVKKQGVDRATEMGLQKNKCNKV
jgi:hypothetical protein